MLNNKMKLKASLQTIKNNIEKRGFVFKTSCFNSNEIATNCSGKELANIIDLEESAF